ncbi:MAG: site-specific integrase [Nitrospirae bacterium]|nr:site-specific integrase [Nitrospirota bacterium]
MIYKRGAVWWVKLKWEGQVVRQSTGERDKAKAELAERRILKELAKGRWVERNPGEHVLFAEVWEKYMVEEAPLKAPGTYERARQCAKNFLSVLGSLQMSKITPSVLSAYRNRRLRDGVEMATVAKELQFVRRVFSLCKSDWELVSRSPFETFKITSSDKQLVRYLEPGQPENLMLACPSWLKPYVAVARFTGIRRGNLCSLTWEQVNLKDRVIVLPTTKNGQPLAVPLADTPYRTLESLLRLRDKYPDCRHVFHKDGSPLVPGQVTKAFERACKKAGIENFRLHDLRHDYASSLVQKGVSMYQVESLLGHKDGRMTRRYAHLRMKDLQDAVSVLG